MRIEFIPTSLIVDHRFRMVKLKYELSIWSEKYNIPVYGYNSDDPRWLQVRFIKESYYTMFLLTWKQEFPYYEMRVNNDTYRI